MVAPDNDEATRLKPIDDTRIIEHATVLDAGQTVVLQSETRLAGDDTVLTRGEVIDDLSEVSVPRVRRAESAAAATWHVRVAGGEMLGLHRPIAIGRRPETPLNPTERILLLTWDPDDHEVSGTHLLVEQDGSRVVITDLASVNGTRVSVPGRPSRRLGPRESLLANGEATVEFGARGKIWIVPPAPAASSHRGRA